MTARNLSQWLAYLEQLHPSAIDMGLERVRAVSRQLGLTRPAARVVTVTGTNGKGSTCAFVANLLRAHGHRVGVYSSPHLLRYNERVLIEGQPADDAALCAAFMAVEQARGDISLTYFEMGTLAAFWLFEQQALDAVVLEVGLGGRLDAVNIVDPDVSVITNIGLDHAEWLGDTRDSVAREKAGIYRAGRPAICGDRQPPVSLLTAAQELGCSLQLNGRDFMWAETEGRWAWQGVRRTGDVVTLSGLPILRLPMDNAAVALQAFAQLDMGWELERIREALLATAMPGRLQSICVNWQGKAVNVLLDVAHNPHAATFLAEYLAAHPVAGTRRVAFGVLADKNLEGILQPLKEQLSDWCVATLNCPRARAAADVANVLAEYGLQVTQADSLAQAIEVQCTKSQADDEVLVFGSFYSVAEALLWLEQLPVVK